MADVDDTTTPVTPESAIAAIAAVLSIPELVTNIMVHLDVVGVHTARRVARIWNAQYLSSKEIRMAGALVPSISHGLPVSHFPMCALPNSVTFARFMTPLYNCPYTIVIQHSFPNGLFKRQGQAALYTKDLAYIDNVTKILASHGIATSSFFTHPPCRAIGIETRYDAHIQRKDIHQQAMIYNPAGVRVADVMAVVKKLRKQAGVGNQLGLDFWHVRAVVWSQL